MKLLLKKVSMLLLLAGISLRADITESYELDQENTEGLVKSNSCKKFNNVAVCGSLKIYGNATVNGSVTANSFFTTNGPLPIPGLLNYAVLTNQAAVTSGNNILWAATPAGNLSSGITFNNATGVVTLPTSGLFLIRYTVRLANSPFSGNSNAVAQLQQTNAGSPANIVQAAITTQTGLDGVTEVLPDKQSQLTGYALVSVTSAENNNINLLVTLSGNFTILAASGTDANAEMAIFQIK